MKIFEFFYQDLSKKNQSKFRKIKLSPTWQQKCIVSYIKYIEVVVIINNQPTLALNNQVKTITPGIDIKVKTISA